MKQFLTLISLVTLGLFFSKSYAQDYNSPVEYMSAISKQQENVSKKYMAYTSASAHGKRERKVQSLRSKLMDEIQEAKMNINVLPSFKGDNSYRDSAVNFMKFYYNVMNDDYSKVINMEEIAEQSYDEMEAYILLEEKIAQKLAGSNSRMQEAQKKFATKNNVKLLEDKSDLAVMMNESSEVSKYEHEVYLIFFKPYIQEKNMMEALKKVNITAVEQNKSSMLKYAKEGLIKLTAMKGYKGDFGLVGSCKTLLNFYVKEAEKMSAINDYYLTKEKFEKIKKDMDNKGNSATKEEVDAFNKSVNEINKASQNYNAVNNELNQERNETLNNWNRGVRSFYDEFTPKYR